MTAFQKTEHDPNRSATMWSIVIAFLLTLILKNPQIATEYMKQGLILCATSLIPSLFPFMVLAELLASSGFGIIEKVLGPLVHRLFRLPKSAASAILLGMVCGFPIGTKTAVLLYDQGALSKNELARLMVVCNLPSAGFLLSVVGSTLYGNQGFGTYLFVVSLIVSFLSGISLRPFGLQETIHLSPTTRAVPTRPFYERFTQAIASATTSILSVCACVIFFTATVGCLSQFLAAVPFPPIFRTMLFGIFELSSGVNAAATHKSLPISAALCGFAVGWSGISVHMQILSVIGSRKIPLAPYFIAKLIQGLLCAFLAFLYVLFFPYALPSCENTTAFLPVISIASYIPHFLLFFFFLLFRAYHKKRESLDKNRAA